jgi:hypothetical protein
MKKTIKMICYGPIACGPKYQSPWEDVWIEYFIGKGKIKQEGPCIIGYHDLENEISIKQSLPVKRHSDWLDNYIKELLYIKDRFLKGYRFGCVNFQTGTPNIYVNKELINRKLAEEAVAWYLKEKGILKSEPRFKWKKPFIIIEPVSLGVKK